MSVPRGMLGAEATLYYSTTYTSPSWVLVPSVSDCQVAPKWDKQEASTRVTRMKQYLKTMLDVSITAKLRASVANDTAYTAIYTSMLAPDSILTIMVLNGPEATNGVWGFMFDAQIGQAQESQNLGDVTFDDIEIFPAATGNPGNYAVVASAAPVFTAI